MKKLLVITGQTATGKTKLAAEQATKYHGEIINADSRQVYKYLDVISGKDLDVIKNIPIHLYDICDPKEHFSSHQWATLAQKRISNLVKQGKLPIIVGGTYLYLAHLLYGIDTEGIKPDWNLRKKLSRKTVPQLQEVLQSYSREALAQLNDSDLNNPRRLIRKIEIVTQGRDLEPSNIQEFATFFEDFDIDFTGLYYPDKMALKKALQNRVHDRLKNGAIDEFKSLLQKGYQLHDPGLSANACLEIYQYLTGYVNLEELADRWVTIEMQYAKRQYTFMKRDKNIKWTEVS